MEESLIQAQLKDIEARFASLKSEINEFQNQVNQGNKEIAVRREELIRLQGDFRGLTTLKAAMEKKTDKEVELPEAVKAQEKGSTPKKATKA